MQMKLGIRECHIFINKILKDEAFWMLKLIRIHRSDQLKFQSGWAVVQVSIWLSSTTRFNLIEQNYKFQYGWAVLQVSIWLSSTTRFNLVDQFYIFQSGWVVLQASIWLRITTSFNLIEQYYKFQSFWAVLQGVLLILTIFKLL